MSFISAGHFNGEGDHYVTHHEADNLRRREEEALYDALDRPEDILLEAMENIAKLRQLPPIFIEHLRAIWLGVSKNGGVQTLITAYIEMSRSDERLIGAQAVLMQVMGSKKPRLEIDCISVVCELNLRMGMSETELAKLHGISKQAFSKRCTALSERLGMAPSRTMRTERSREIYRIRQEKQMGLLRSKLRGFNQPCQKSLPSEKQASD